jgi:hypothetical protein
MPASETRSHTSRRNGHAATDELEDLDRLLGQLPQRVRREVATHPGTVLASVAGVAFLGGAVLGSRLGRAILAAAIPAVIERVIATELGPRLLRLAATAWREVGEGANRAEA